MCEKKKSSPVRLRCGRSYVASSKMAFLEDFFKKNTKQLFEIPS